MEQILQEFFYDFFREVCNKIEKVYSSLTEIILAQNFMGEKKNLHFFDIHSVFQPKWVK